MKFWHPPKPCNDCPFRREGGIRLVDERILEIASCVIPADGQGGTFPCHKTVNHDERDPQSELHCTGALIFAYKNEMSSQMVRIAERLGQIDPALVDDDHPEIFDTLDEWLATALERSTRRPRSRQKRRQHGR